MTKDDLTIFFGKDTGSSTANGFAKLVNGEPLPHSVPKDLIKTPPRIEKDDTRVWLCKLNTELGPAAIATWLVEAPWAHPVWHSYVVCLYHLRNIEGEKEPPIIHRPNATHEFCVMAFDPDKDRNIVIETGDVKGILVPFNFVGQFVEISDELAAMRVRFTISEIVSKKLNPDTDFSSQWVERYGNWMYKDR